MIRPRYNTIRPTVKLRWLIRWFAAAVIVIVCSSCEQAPPYVGPLSTAAGYPSAPPPGWWDDEGVSGSPKIVVNIGDQKAYFYKGKHLVGETTVSTGKPGFSTPPGRYQVLSKSPDHVSTLFGDYVDDYGNIVRSNIDSRKDRRPPGTHFDGAEMPYAMFFRGGYAMHQGYVPPFAASHGCIRLPRGMARPFFENAPVGTPVTVKE
jgi:lipoprotein-anchoring transpeptidase ErfK/SrfK